MKKLPNKYFEEGFIPTNEEIKNDFIGLFPQGNIENTYATIPYVIDADIPYKTVEDGEVLTFGYLIEKYEKYLKYWNAKFGEKDPKYIGKKDTKRTPEMFLLEKIYNQIFDIERTPRDLYIVTKLKRETLERKHKLFLKILEDAKK